MTVPVHVVRPRRETHPVRHPERANVGLDVRAGVDVDERVLPAADAVIRPAPLHEPVLLQDRRDVLEEAGGARWAVYAASRLTRADPRERAVSDH
jgi:hypothetical protein